MDEYSLPDDVGDSQEGWTPYYPSSQRDSATKTGQLQPDPKESVLTAQWGLETKGQSRKRDLGTALFEQTCEPSSSDSRLSKTRQLDFQQH
jgi:hypothetical protein